LKSHHIRVELDRAVADVGAWNRSRQRRRSTLDDVSVAFFNDDADSELVD